MQQCNLAIYAAIYVLMGSICFNIAITAFTCNYAAYSRHSYI